jgi:hypothetical protein
VLKIDFCIGGHVYVEGAEEGEVHPNWVERTDTVGVAMNQIDGSYGWELVKEFAENGSFWESLLSPRATANGQVSDGVQDQRSGVLEAKVRNRRRRLAVTEHTPAVPIFDGDA